MKKKILSTLFLVAALGTIAFAYNTIQSKYSGIKIKVNSPYIKISADNKTFSDSLNIESETVLQPCTFTNGNFYDSEGTQVGTGYVKNIVLFVETNTDYTLSYDVEGDVPVKMVVRTEKWSTEYTGRAKMLDIYLYVEEDCCGESTVELTITGA